MKKIIFLIIISVAINLHSQNNIKRIEFYTEGYASAPDFDIIIYSDRIAVFIARSDNYKQKVNGDIVPYGVNENGVNIRDSEVVGIYKTKLKKKTFNKLLRLINSLKNEFKKQIYSSNQLHNSEAKLIVLLKNGETISIHDTGLNGTIELVELYNFFKIMRFNEKWE